MSLEQKLIQSCSEFSLPLNIDTAEAMIAYLHLLEKWDKVHNLTAVHGVEEMIERHIVDSLSAVPYLWGQRIADVGTGAGLPGIPLALYFPEKDFVLIEANAKRISFLRHACAKLGLKNVTIVHGRVPSVEVAPRVDQILSRAFSAVGLFLEQTAYLLTPNQNGSWLAFKGKLNPEELASISDFDPKLEYKTISLPFLRESNLLLIERRSIMAK
jgi:16S rRNA (guanine527-N7)-methyltransferase